MNIDVINKSSKCLPQELLTAISGFKDFDTINDIAEAWNLKVVEIKFNYTEDKNWKVKKLSSGTVFSEK